jgi:hypothetical protein
MDAPTTTHLLAHVIIFMGYLLAIAQVVPVFSALIRLSLVTRISGAGFFLFCGVTHAGLALDRADSAIVATTDHLQAVSIIVFILFLSRDLASANRRLTACFEQIGSGSAVAVAAALQDVRR